MRIFCTDCNYDHIVPNNTVAIIAELSQGTHPKDLAKQQGYALGHVRNVMYTIRRYIPCIKEGNKQSLITRWYIYNIEMIQGVKVR